MNDTDKISPRAFPLFHEPFQLFLIYSDKKRRDQPENSTGIENLKRKVWTDNFHWLEALRDSLNYTVDDAQRRIFCGTKRACAWNSFSRCNFFQRICVFIVGLFHFHSGCKILSNVIVRNCLRSDVEWKISQLVIASWIDCLFFFSMANELRCIYN